MSEGRRIEDYAMIGDCRSAALVGRDGSIDWLCWPRFDSAACFAALLGDRDNGRWQLAPTQPYSMTRQYRGGSLCLESRFRTDTGEVSVIDFMPTEGAPPSVVRLVRCTAGRVEMRAELVLRFDYGSTIPWIRRSGEGELTAVAGSNLVVLRSEVQLHGEDLRSVARFILHEGESRCFVLSYGHSIDPAPPPFDAEAALERTETAWDRWSGRCADAGPWNALVRRSLILVRGLTYNPTGGIVAAVTTSLPERIGGERNWDYRYCWLRDATFTLLALMRANYHEEAQAWRDWLQRAIAGSPDQMQIVYGLDGEKDLYERTLPWLSGFRGSRPVRVGNAAAEQQQTDIYGELAHLMGRARQAGLPPSDHSRDVRRAIMSHLERIWRQPDESIWEVRGGRRHFTYSKVMAWLAFRSLADDAHVDETAETRSRWRHVAEVIHAEVCREGYDAVQGSFVQSYGSGLLDASLLQLPLVGFLPVNDPRMAGTIAAVEKRLLRGGLVLRYETEHGVDGLPPGEGAFLACSFWLVDCYVLQGRLDEARALFEHLAGLCNDVGLMAEEYDPRGCCMLGNVPQAFSHVALINAAYSLSSALGTQ
jgi:GH15 family glucan-1,4-alpha-glucosidase